MSGIKQVKGILSRILPMPVYSFFREQKILIKHRRVASICEKFVENSTATIKEYKLIPKKKLYTDKIIWQYWSQGYSDLPKVIDDCMRSVDANKGDCLLVRLSDKNMDEYIDLPQHIIEKKGKMSKAHFSDMLRLCLLSTYGGIWLDATVFMSGPIPNYFFEYDFFAFQRDFNEKNKEYWKNAYAYYYGWNNRFRVNMLNSIMSAKSNTALINELTFTMIEWWEKNDSLPDYFFFQILFDVLVKGKMKKYNCKIMSDCLPHYLQQQINDPDFFVKSKEEILRIIPIHKLTYK